MNTPPFPVFDASATAALLDFRALVDALAVAACEQAAGRIHAPVRASVPFGENGVLLSMLASAADIAIHKLVSVCPANRARGLPTISGTLTVCDGITGQPEFVLDGPTVTGRRTAALSMLGIRLFHPGLHSGRHAGLDRDAPRCVLIIGTGQQARFHALALSQLYPRARLFVQGRKVANEEVNEGINEGANEAANKVVSEVANEVAGKVTNGAAGGVANEAAGEVAFCRQMAREHVTVMPAGGVVPADADTVIAVTTSKTPVYTGAARADRLVIGVGAFTPDAAEIGPDTVRASHLVVDDKQAALAEAGDLLLARVDWADVRSVGEWVSALGNGWRDGRFSRQDDEHAGGQGDARSDMCGDARAVSSSCTSAVSSSCMSAASSCASRLAAASPVLPASAALSMPPDAPVLFKTVGSGAWDLAAGRLARQVVRGRRGT